MKQMCRQSWLNQWSAVQDCSPGKASSYRGSDPGSEQTGGVQFFRVSACGDSSMPASPSCAEYAPNTVAKFKNLITRLRLTVDDMETHRYRIKVA